MQNKLSDLNNHLFAQMERLSDENLSGEALLSEINRSKAVTDVAQQIIANSSLVLKAHVAAYEVAGERTAVPKMLTE